MATVTISVVSNADGSMTATSSATAPAQTVTSLSLTEIQTVIRGWIQQGLWRYRTQLMDEPSATCSRGRWLGKSKWPEKRLSLLLHPGQPRK